MAIQKYIHLRYYKYMTQNDLSQIRAVFKEEIQKEVKIVVEDVLEQKLEEKLEKKLEEKLEQKLEEKLEQKLDQKFEQRLKPINKKLNKLQKGQNIILKYVDEQDTSLDNRVTRIEKHLHLSSSPLQ